MIRNSAGFTFIELVIAVSIIALTLAFSGPKLEQIAKSQKVKSVAREIYTNLQLARMTAIKEDEDIEVTFGIDDDSPPTMTIHRTDDSTVIPDINFSSQFRGIQLSSTRDGLLVYNSKGSINGNNNQTIQVTHTDVTIDREYDVVISVTGGIRFVRTTKESS